VRGGPGRQEEMNHVSISNEPQAKNAAPATAPQNHSQRLYHLGKKWVRNPVLVVTLKYALGITLLAYLIWMNQDKLVELLHKPKRLEPFLLACGLTLGGLLLTFVRWYILVRAVNLPFTLVNALRLGLVGYFMSTFLPGAVGGDIIKAAFIAREQNRRTVA